MTDTITLPRAVAVDLQNAMRARIAVHGALAFREDINALSALDAALAEPNAKPEPATVEQIDEEYIRPVIDARWHDFEAGFRAAERFHGIGKEDGK